MAVIIPIQTVILPEGMDPTEYPYNWHVWAIYIRWQNRLGYTVTGGWEHERLSVKGRTWTFGVEDRNRHLYYFPTYQEALAAAEEEAEKKTYLGKTWEESKDTWKEH